MVGRWCKDGAERRRLLLLLLVGYSRQDYGDYGAAAQGNGCYKARRATELDAEERGGVRDGCM